jgi:hypothetical protein
MKEIRDHSDDDDFEVDDPDDPEVEAASEEEWTPEGEPEVKSIIVCRIVVRCFVAVEFSLHFVQTTIGRHRSSRSFRDAVSRDETFVKVTWLALMPPIFGRYFGVN